MRPAWRWLSAFWLMLTAAAMAHPILQNPMWVEVAPEKLFVKVLVSIRELGVVQGVPIAADGSVDAGLAAETAPRHIGYLLDHLHFRADGVPLSGMLMSIEPPKEIGKGMEATDLAHFTYRLEYPLPQPPAQVSLSHTMVQEFPSAPGVPWDLSYIYRFGPPGAVPVEFGTITRDVLVTYNTGFAQPPGTAPPPSPAVRRWPLLTGLGLLAAALGLGVDNRREQFRLLMGSGLLFSIGWSIGSFGGVKMPAFLAAALGGIGVMLVSVDNIHRPLAPAGFRRWAMALFFPAAAGLAAWNLSPDSGPARTQWYGECFGLFGVVMLATATLTRMGANRPAPEGREGRHPWIQLASLLICVGGMVVLLEGLGIRPWTYWLNRLKG